MNSVAALKISSSVVVVYDKNGLLVRSFLCLFVCMYVHLYVRKYVCMNVHLLLSMFVCLLVHWLFGHWIKWLEF